MPSLNNRFLYYLFPSIVLLILIVWTGLSILSLNGGIFSYTLDDPYIHLSLAQHISDGEYGFTSGESASPSSSILWPFILVPFAQLSFFELMPLLLNTLFSFFILWTFISLYLSVTENPTFQWKAVILFFLLIPAFNLVGLIFSGLEHSLQMLLGVLLVYGLITESREGTFPPWLALVIIVGPLIRYENLALAVPGLVYLFYRGHKKQALIVFCIMSILLTAFSLFLIHLGQPPLASSILIKMLVGYYHSFLAVLFAQLDQNLAQRQCFIFIFFLIGFVGFIFYSKINFVEKQLMGMISAAIILYLLVGKFNWFNRYELFLYSAVWLMALYFYFLHTGKSNNWGLYLSLLAVLIISSMPYFQALAELPLAANNIFSQQYQMRKFVIEWVKAPVAVNDIGWVSFNNPYYVLDLWGLGNYPMYQQRCTHSDSQWMAKATDHAKVKLAMLYQPWFPVPPAKWKLLGCLELTSPVTSIADKRVYFYATDLRYFSELQQQLMQFRYELPKGTIFDFDCSAN